MTDSTKIAPEVKSRVNLQVDSLNGLRGLAAIVVILSHASIAGYHPLPHADFSGNGKSGVYLFFLLSSFLLSRPFFVKGASSYERSKLQTYWKRRFLRVYPLYSVYVLFFGLATYLCFKLAGYDLGAFAFSPMMVLRQLLLLEAWGVTWTIIVEFKFYLVLPLITFLALQCETRLRRSLVPVFFLILIVASLMAFPPATVKNNDISLGGYFYLFILGVSMGWFDVNYSQKMKKLASSKWLSAVGIIGLVMLAILTPSAYSALIRDVPYDYFHTKPIPQISAWIMVMTSAVYGRGMLYKWLKSKALTYAGTISFSVYLLHSPVISFARRTGMSGVSGFWFIVGVTVAISIVSYKVIEKPTSKLR